MSSLMSQVESKYKKSQVVDVMPGDTVKVHQKIKEGNKERIQIFEGLVIKVTRKNSHTATIRVRRVASGVGVEKTYLLHSPLVLKVEVTKRSKVRRNYLTYMRDLTGKSARLSGLDFDKQAVNAVHDERAEAEEEKLHEKAEAEHLASEAVKEENKVRLEAKVEEALAGRDKSE